MIFWNHRPRKHIGNTIEEINFLPAVDNYRETHWCNVHYKTIIIFLLRSSHSH